MITTILINNNWEQVKDIDDIYRIVSENINKEFADEVKSLFEQNDKIYDLECEIEELEIDKASLENQLDDEQSAYEELEEIVEKLKEALDDAAYQAVSHQHPNCYDYSEYKKQYLKELADSYKIPSEYMPKVW